MQSSKITLIAGPPGSGKTTWIRQQLTAIAQPATYIGLGLGSVPIDAAYLTAEVPQLTVLEDVQLTQFLEGITAGHPTFIEVGFHIDLASLVLPIDLTACDRVAVLPPNPQPTEWQAWAETIAEGSPSQVALQQPRLWRSPLSGQVFDPASLNTFWSELTQGAYGDVQRAKGIFDLSDGRAFYFSFVAGLPESEYIELNLSPWLTGRPDRFSGVEILGQHLDEAEIVQTLKDCCLDDRAIEYYQQQLQQQLQDEPAEETR